MSMFTRFRITCTLALSLVALTVSAAAQIGGTATAAAASPVYYLALGDSLAYGVGASGPQYDYVNLTYAQETSRIEGLQLENFSCPGETTTSMIDGPGCGSGAQLTEAESFLEAHPGQVAFVTIDIGGSDFDLCIDGTSVDATCVSDTLNTVNDNLSDILSGLSGAYPDLPLFGMDYYDPFLAAWLNGGDDQSAAEATVPYFDELNAALSADYDGAGFQTADVASTFQTDDSDLTGSYSDQTLPQNVADVCNWTHMCGPLYTQPNNAGHAQIADTFEPLIDAATIVTACDPPSITSANSATAVVGESFLFTVTTCTTTVPHIGVTGLPPGLQIEDNQNGTATITGTPAIHDFGTYSATISASIEGEPIGTQTFELTVDNAPVFKTKATYTAHTGETFSYPITTLYGYPVPTITTSSPLPTGITLNDLGTGRATLGGTPASGDGGIYPVTISAVNSLTTVDQSFTLTVYQAPSVVAPSSVSVTDGVGMTPVTFAFSGYPAPKVTATGLPKGLVMVNNLNGTATISGTPGARDPAGTFTVTIHASSKAGNTSQSFLVNVST